MPSPGILLNMVACLIVAGSALALLLFFLPRRHTLGASVSAYAIFWFLTFITWSAVASRYLRIWLGYPWNEWSIVIETILQTSVFTSAIPLAYYICTRLGVRQSIRYGVVFLSTLTGAVALWFIVAQSGVSQPRYTYFSAEPTIHFGALLSFGVIATILWILLTVDVWRGVKEYRISHATNALYSIAPFVYLTLGVVDQMKLIIDWPLIIFRSLYAAAILFVYILVTQYEQSNTPFITVAGAPTSTSEKK